MVRNQVKIDKNIVIIENITMIRHMFKKQVIDALELRLDKTDDNNPYHLIVEDSIKLAEAKQLENLAVIVLEHYCQTYQPPWRNILYEESKEITEESKEITEELKNEEIKRNKFIKYIDKRLDRFHIALYPLNKYQFSRQFIDAIFEYCEIESSLTINGYQIEYKINQILDKSPSQMAYTCLYEIAIPMYQIYPLPPYVLLEIIEHMIDELVIWKYRNILSHSQKIDFLIKMKKSIDCLYLQKDITNEIRISKFKKASLTKYSLYPDYRIQDIIEKLGDEHKYFNKDEIHIYLSVEEALSRID